MREEEEDEKEEEEDGRFVVVMEDVGLFETDWRRVEGGEVVAVGYSVVDITEALEQVDFLLYVSEQMYPCSC